MISTQTNPRLRGALIVVLILAGFCFGQSGERSATAKPDASFTRTNWSQFGFTPDLIRFNPYETVLSTSNVANLTLKWSHILTGTGENNFPVVVDGVVYVGTQQRFYAFKASTGDELWNVKLTTQGSPAVANGIVYVGSHKSVYALKAATGAKLWTYTTKNAINSLTLADGVLYAGSNGVYALDAKTGKPIWTYPTEPGVYLTAPAVLNGTAYSGWGDRYDDEGGLYALNASTGALLWTYNDITFTSATAPAVANGTAFFGDGSYLEAVDTGTQALLWSYGDLSQQSPAVANGVVYGANGGSSCYALDAVSGDELWSSVGCSGSPAVANGVVYTNSNYENAYALDASTGATLWSYTAVPYVSSPVVVNGVLYIASSKNIYAFGLK